MDGLGSSSNFYFIQFFLQDVGTVSRAPTTIGITDIFMLNNFFF